MWAYICYWKVVIYLVQFAKSQAVSNVRALQIFERKVLLSIWTVEKFSNVTLFRQLALYGIVLIVISLE